MEKNLKVWFTSPETKIRPRSHLTWGKKEDFHIYVAKNATEGCQVSFMAPEDRPGFSLDVRGRIEDAGFSTEILKEHYVSCEGAMWPDPVVPDSGKFDLEAGINTTYLINIKTTEKTVPGTYKLKVVLKEKGKIYGKYDLKVTVWAFTIAPKKHMDTAFGIDQRFLQLRHKSDNPDELYKKYYDFMLEKYRICSDFLPYDILDPRADEYLDNPAVTSFRIPHDVSDETIAKYYEKLSKKQSWLDKSYFYGVDEPCNMEAYDKILAFHKRLSKCFPGYNAVSPFFKDPSDGGGKKAVDLLDGITKVWCPKARLFTEKWFCDRMHEIDARGERVWWYVCWEPGLPYANVFVDMEGFYTRVLMWQQWLHDVRGLLYWTTTWWRDCNPWDSASTVRDLSWYCFGDGSLFYPGDRVGIDGPVGSLRFEILRSGIEDFYLLQMAEEAFGRKYVEKLVKSVSPNVREYNDDHDHLDRVRILIGNRLSRYYKEMEK